VPRDLPRAPDRRPSTSGPFRPRTYVESTADVRSDVGRSGTGRSSTSGSIEHAVHNARGSSGGSLPIAGAIARRLGAC